MERFVGRYALLRLLGQGGMGTVHLALDLSTGREVALKRLNAGVLASAPESLRREFEVLTRVRHPAVVGVYELGFAPDGTTYYTMEYVPGVRADLGLARGDWKALCFAAAEVAHGLEALHGVGVLHGDLKPSNLLVTPGAAVERLPAGVRILDFGLAALLDREREGHRGTPGFAAPEVVRGEGPEVASDLFSLGATLYALAVPPPPGRSASSTRTRARASAQPSQLALDEAGVPARLAQLVLRLMAPLPGDRPRDAREVRAELERIEPGARRSLDQRLRTEIVTGREPELARLERWLARAPEGPRVTVIDGGPGAGKSALLGELSVRAALAGYRVIRLSCAALPGPGALALALWKRLAADAGAEPDGSVGSAPVLSLLDSPNPAPDESALTALADSAAGWSRAPGARGALALVLLDDLEKLDPLSRTLVRRLVLHPGASALRWVWAGREAEGGADEGGRVLVDAGRAQRLELRPLDAGAVERLVAARLHATPPGGMLDLLAGRSGGNPGLIVELLRAAAEAGALRESEDGIVVDAAALAALALPEDFETSRLARIGAASPAAKQAAIALAVRSRPARGDELPGRYAASAGPALAELHAAGLVTRTEEGAFALSPPVLASALLATLDDVDRRRAHREALSAPGLSAAERFALLRGAGDPAGALSAAREAIAAGSGAALAVEAAAVAQLDAPGEEGEWLERAAELFRERSSYASMIPLLERALEIEPPGPRRTSCWGRLGVAYLRAGRPGDVERVVSRAMSEDLPDGARASLIVNDAGRLRAQGRHAEALARVNEALPYATRSGSDQILGDVHFAHAGLLLDVDGRAEEAGVQACLAQDAFVRAGHRAGQMRAIGMRAVVAEVAADPIGAERLYREGLALTRAEGFRLAYWELMRNLAVTLLRAGRWGESSDCQVESLRMALEDGRPGGVALTMAQLSVLDALTGRPERALRRARAAARLTHAWLPRYEPTALRVIAQAYRIAGRPRRAERAATAALAAATRVGLQQDQDWCRLEFARICEQGNRWRESGEVASVNLAHLATGEPIVMAISAVVAGRAALRRRDFAAVDARLADAAGALARRTAPFAEANVAQLEAERALVLGNAAEGVAHAARCLKIFEQLPAPPDRARAALEFARLAMSADAAPDAPITQWLQDAAGAFERMGDRPNRERTLALTVEWLHRSRVPGSTAASERGLLQSVSRLLGSLADLQVLSKRAMEMAVEHLDAERGVLLFADEASGKLSPVVEHGAVDAATRNRAVGYSRRVVERVARSGGSLLVGDAPTHPDVLSESVVDLGLRSILCVPLYGAGKVIGAVYVDDTRRPDAFSADDRGLLEGFAQLMASAIESSKGNEEVRRANEQLVGENLSLRREARVRFQPHNFIGASSVMQEVLAVTERAAQTAATVLVTGENGTGKELIARLLHHGGARHEGPFVSINCGALTGTLLESELFGILDKVASDVRGRPGCFVRANGGTLFLDEIGEMPVEQQVALLSVLANREVTPVGGASPIPVDVRIVAATNLDLARRVADGAFRVDLFYRLNVIPIEIPPLRARKADIPAMARFFAAEVAAQQKRKVPDLSPEFLGALMQSDWPGNVRELQNYIERVMALSPEDVLLPRPLPGDLEKRSGRRPSLRGRRLAEVVGELEQRLVREALERSAGNQSQAARELGLTEQSLRYRLRKLNAEAVRRTRRVRKKRR